MIVLARTSYFASASYFDRMRNRVILYAWSCQLTLECTNLLELYGSVSGASRMICGD